MEWRTSKHSAFWTGVPLASPVHPAPFPRGIRRAAPAMPGSKSRRQMDRGPCSVTAVLALRPCGLIPGLPRQGRG